MKDHLSANCVVQHSCWLKTHMHIHTDERPLHYEECGATFSQTCNLKMHMRTHTGERPFKCKMFDAAFIGSGNIKKHMRTHTRVNDHLSVKSVVQQSVKFNLKIHMYTH